MNSDDPRRRIPRTDDLLGLVPELSLSRAKALIKETQDAARRGDISPEEVPAQVIAGSRVSSLTPVINATGVIVHTNLGRAPYSEAAKEAMLIAAGYVDVEMDLDTGKRSHQRGAHTKQALLEACPSAQDALVVNNGAAALLLATACLAHDGEVIISRGELIEIGAGFRLPELIESAHVRLREVGATNRTHPQDYERAINDRTKALLKVHPSNFRIEGFTSDTSVSQLREIADRENLKLIVDLGSGLFDKEPLLPTEPTVSEQLAQGADVVICSGDKLMGGPQAGILLGKKEVIAALKKHPLARAVRADKTMLAALEATLRHREIPVHDYLSPQDYEERTRSLASALGAEVVAHDGRVGGGGAPGFPLPGFAVVLDDRLTRPLRLGDPSVVGQVHDGKLLIDLRCVPQRDDEKLKQAIRTAQKAFARKATVQTTTAQNTTA